ncbi:MAG: histidine phosphatase family protein [Candidatus Komeilibacteria bacterium]|nr:histidine phosphatase family protein [Candidatus Komeilibacteria bacterium]
MRWLGNYIFEWLRGPWPEMLFIRHGHGFHQVGYERVDEGLAKSPLEALGFDISNHLVPLSPMGRDQSSQTGGRLNFRPDIVYASQMRRAIETAELVFPLFTVRQDPRLNEKDFGVGHMMGTEYLEQYYPDHIGRYRRDGKYFSAKAPGGENYIHLFLRLHSLLDTIRRDWAGKKVAVFCHSAVMLAIRQLLEHHDPEQLFVIGKKQDLVNCAILHYRPPERLWGWSRGKFRIELVQPPYVLWKTERTYALETEHELRILKEKFS